MTHLRRWLRRFLVRSWPLLLAIGILLATPALVAQNRYGRAAVEASVYLPDMLFQLPDAFRPVELFTDPPVKRRVEIGYQSRNGPRTVEADLYLPASGTAHSAVIFSMGAPPLDLDDPRLERLAEDAARADVAMLVPFSERLNDMAIEPEEIDALVAEFDYVQELPQVDPQRVGFIGVSVGGSLALTAAADSRIASDVEYVVSFGGYFDALDTFGAIATHRIEYDGVDEEWTPRYHAEKVMAYQLINRVDSARDRDLLRRWFIEHEDVSSEELASLSPTGRSSYDFLANRDPKLVTDLIDRLPADGVAELDYLSPRTTIDHVQAELFIIHDRADPFIPYTESRKLMDALGDRPNTHYDEIRLFEHVEPRLNQRPEIIATDVTRLLFRLYQLLLLWKGA